MERMVERKRRRLEMRPVYTRSEPELEAPPLTIVDWTTKEDTLFQNAVKVLAVKFDRKELDAIDGLLKLAPGPNDMNTTKRFPGNPLRVLRMNAPSAWSDVFKN